ncbi:hypothetical protein DPMN_185685 [Dreissena polymorpha]|uniref:Uncharacterized protein n=1 Tax=Dreissena polymorpha TaxID=45954 RepID=A0A9D4DLD6_DREPO|nr:hypothetical protein DPMN_185685 [Dreissena polymorpha]
MSEDPDGSTLSLGTSKESTGWKLCTICQEKNNNKGTVILNPRTESYQKLLDIVADRASVQDGEYVTLQRRLQDCTKQTMLEAKAMWHRSCYSCATNEIQISTDHKSEHNVCFQDPKAGTTQTLACTGHIPDTVCTRKSTGSRVGT